jgi:threonine dehydrogenase-like Zn-dependent dehydrogenase
MSEIPDEMWQIVKPEGFGNMTVAKAQVPSPGSRQVLVRTKRSLISRGSEIGGRYRKEEALSPDVMGYSVAGEVVALGPDVDQEWIGRRVGVMAPHAQYVIGDLDAIAARAVTVMPNDVTFEQAAFHPLTVGGLMWTKISATQPGESIAVVGQGLIGNMVMQAAKRYQPDLTIAIDAIEARCERALEFGADVAVNAREEDPVARVKELTDGAGVHLALECVGGPAGVKSFAQSVEMTRRLGRIHLISLYHEQPLPLSSQAIQSRMLIGGYYTDLEREWRPAADEAMALLAAGEIRVDPLVTHRFPFTDAKDAFDLLHDRLSEAMGVVFTWDA